MNKKQVDQYNMLLTVEFHFDNNAPIWTSNIPVSDVKTAFSAKIDEINEAALQQSENSKGATKDKAELRKNLEEKGFFVSAAISAYAAANPGKNQLYNEVHIAKSTFLLFRTPELLTRIEELNNAAMTVIENLEPYGVTQQILTDMMTARDAFLHITRLPEEITTLRKGATENIADLLHEASSLLENQMDNLMEVLRTTQPDFVKAYFNDRIIHHIGERRLSLEILTLDAATNTPLAEAQIEIVGKGIKRISSEKGLNRVQNLQEGYYTLTVSRVKFEPQTIPFAIVNGETTQLVIELQRVSASVPEEEEAE